MIMKMLCDSIPWHLNCFCIANAIHNSAIENFKFSSHGMFWFILSCIHNGYSPAKILLFEDKLSDDPCFNEFYLIATLQPRKQRIWMDRWLLANPHTAHRLRLNWNRTAKFKSNHPDYKLINWNQDRLILNQWLLICPTFKLVANMDLTS